MDVVELLGPRKLRYLSGVRTVVTRSADADLVHAHFGYSGWIGLAQLRRPVVISFMGNDLLGTRLGDGRTSVGSALAVRINRMAARLAAAVIVKSRQMAEVLDGMPVHLVPNGVDLATFQPIERREARARLGWPLDGIVALFPGNPRFPNKGFTIAREAADRAADLLGAPVELRVLWNVAPERVAWVMSACDAMILASRQEGSPNVVKEALACQLPVVATRVGDVPEVLGGLEGCWLCDRTPESMGPALSKALTSGRLRAGRERLIDRGLDDATVAKRIVGIYDEVLARRRGRP
jgi:glycosyltransferase involved in cell wall biosynthesis